jgi:uncharacterized glyoxalase superfamily protein PhnB
MPKLNSYLNFDGTAEEAFTFYQSVFGGELGAIHKMGDMPGSEQLADNEKNRVMHISLPIGKDDLLMGSDIHTSPYSLKAVKRPTVFSTDCQQEEILKCQSMICSGAIISAVSGTNSALAG